MNFGSDNKKRKSEKVNLSEPEPKKLKTDPGKEPLRSLFLMPTFGVPSSNYGHWRLESLTASFTAPKKDPSRTFEPAVCYWPPQNQGYVSPESVRILLHELYFAGSKFFFVCFL